jgi:hypothetical protein
MTQVRGKTVPQRRNSKLKRFICDFEARIIRRMIKCDQRRRACRTIAFKIKMRKTT